MGVTILIILIALFVQIWISMKFASIAEDKGYDGLSYGLLCFFFSVVGCCMVAALPDLKMQETLNDITRKLDKVHSKIYQKQSAPVAAEPTQPTECNEPAAPESILAPTATDDDKIICPICGTKQPVNRKVCWSCGQKFTTEEKA